MEVKKVAPYILIAAIFVAVFGIFIGNFGKYACYNVYREIYDFSNTNLNLEPLLKNIPKIGNGNKIIVIEFIDPYCPYSKIYYGNPEFLNLWRNRTGTNFNPGRAMLLKLANENKITLYSVDFPLESIHPGSLNVSAALYCVYEKYGSQAYFDLKNKIYLNNNWRNVNDVKEIAYNDGYIITDSCINSIKYNITLLQNTFYRLFGISGTPSYVIIIKNPDLRKYLLLYKYALKSGGLGIVTKVNGVESLILVISGVQPAELFSILAG